MRATVLFVPGLRDHVADHWQTLLAEQLPGSRTVPPLAANKLSCAARVEALDQAIRAIDGPIVLVAHSAGVLTVVHWAERRLARIRGALFATPPDLERPLPEGYPNLAELNAGGWLPVPRNQLPFPSMVAASTNDPLAEFERTAELAASWNSLLVDLGEVGHLNPAAGFGPWPRAFELLRSLDRELDA
ncbi:MAG: RBBP9/YdeN family alpha/beta hydrolase [Phenylobacterium sp.]